LAAAKKPKRRYTLISVTSKLAMLAHHLSAARIDPRPQSHQQKSDD
jgi:hypothetical protein